MEFNSQSNNKRGNNFRASRRKAPTPCCPTSQVVLLPRDTEIEAAVLGALMLEKTLIPCMRHTRKPESFYEPRHQRIYEAIQSLGAAQRPIDMLTVIEQLRQNDDLDKVDGAPYIVSLTSGVASAAHIEFHSRIVAPKYLARELINFATWVETSLSTK